MIYLLLEAHLVAALQIMVYAGAIVVLFLFVVMLLNLRQRRLRAGPRSGWCRPSRVLLGRWCRVPSCSCCCSGALPAPPRRCPRASAATARSGIALYTDYVLLVELTSLLLLGRDRRRRDPRQAEDRLMAMIRSST